jgi:hypothetical protein
MTGRLVRLCGAALQNMKSGMRPIRSRETESTVSFPAKDRPGTDVMIFKYFRRKIQPKIGVFDSKLCKILIITLVFETNANLFSENWRKL